jgi:hypothetical protein
MRKLLMGLLILMTFPAAHADPWPTKTFDIYKGDSGVISADDEEALPTESELKKIEVFLSYVATQLEAWGFPAPALEVFSDEACTKCYRIYLDEMVLSSSETFGGTSNFGWSYTTGTNNVITLNSDHALTPDGQTLLAAAYVTAAHELFHAVQDRTNFLFDDNPAVDPNPASHWIKEGTADAVAIYLFETYPKRAQISPNRKEIKGFSKWRQFGPRSYALPLPVKNDEPSDEMADYYTSSFWLYLGETAAARKNLNTGPLPGVGIQEADFSFLVDFFSEENPRYFDKFVPWALIREKELDWLDAALMKHPLFSQHLAETHARFLTTMAGYWDNRYKDYRFRKEQWLNIFFGRCINLPFKPGGASTDRKFEISELAGGCITLDLTGDSDPIQVDLQVTTRSKKQTNQLWIGTAGGQVLARRIERKPLPDDKGDLGIWPGITITPGTPTTLILVNAGDDADETEEISGSVQVTFNHRKQESADAGQFAPPRDTGPNERAEALEDRVDAAGSKLTMNGQFAMQIDQSDDYMTIHLGTAPMAMNALFGLSGSGGILDQMLTAGGAMDNAIAAMNSGEHSGAETAGDDVYIRIPRIPYGFTGTIEGAQISTATRDGTSLFAVGPQDSEPGPQRYFRPSGRVTIKEFSPKFLIASYSAEFVDPESLTPQQMKQSQPTLSVEYSGRESFTVSAPWAHLDDDKESMPVDPWGEARSDLLKRLPPELAGFGSDLISEAQSASEEEREPDFSGISSTYGAPAGMCDCSCQALAALEEMGRAAEAAGRMPTGEERQLAACAMTCMQQYAMCEAD